MLIGLILLFFRQVVEVEKQPKTIVIPRYQPIFVEPNMKEYETQVLQMSVPIDDSERYSDPKLIIPSRKSAIFEHPKHKVLDFFQKQILPTLLFYFGHFSYLHG